MKQVRLALEATEELADAAAWYEARQPGLATKLLEEFERILVQISSRPQSFPRLRDTAPDLGIRRAVLPRFPYALVFLELADEIRVVAVAHAKRQPGYWLDRVTD